MKKINLLFILLLSVTTSILAQVPNAINFQAIARDVNGDVMVNTPIQIRLTVIDGSATGTEVFQELRALTTNNYGSFSFQIGRDANYVTIGTFEGIEWNTGNKFLKIDYDPTNQFDWSLTLGTIEFVSVPFAFSAGSVTYIDLTNVEDGDVLVYNATTEKFEPGQINTTTAWGELTGTPPDVSTFNNDAGYLTSYMETDPVFTAWDKSSGISIIESQISDLQNYLTTEVDGSVTNEIQDLDNVLTQGTDAGNKNITNLANPVNAKDAVTKDYADAIMQVMENNGLTVVDFSADNTTPTTGINIQFTDNSAINPTSWTWDFGDGNTSTEQNPLHSYANAGTYTVSLTANNGTLSKTETKTDYITVNVDGPGAGLTDYDGNSYPSIIIGGQEWMAEDLRVTHYPNGDPIPNITDDAAWGNLGDNNTDDAYCFYNNDNTTDYGALYTYAAAIGDNWTRDNADGQGVCPDGWHLTTDVEWTTLTDYLGGTSVAGGKLKEIGTTHWNSPNTGATNESGFFAIPSGTRDLLSDGTFINQGQNIDWWSASEYDISNSYIRYLSYDYAEVFQDNFNKSSGFSVRCIRD